MNLLCIQPEKLYEKDPKLKREDVKMIQEWLNKQPHLPPIEESQVILFLHGSQYRIEVAKNTLDAYFTRRTLHPEIFYCLSEEVLRKTMSVVFKKILPKKTPNGSIILMSKLFDYRAENFNHLNDIIFANMVGTLSLHQNTCIDGMIGILDFQGGTLGHLARTNFQALKHEFDYLHDGLPIIIKETHIVNTVPFMDKVMSLIKPILKSELFNSIHLHSSLESLYKYVPKECLPEDYGGDLPSCQILQEQTAREIFENLDFFKWHDSQKVDESKRVQKSTIVNGSFGVDGTFKKLEID